MTEITSLVRPNISGLTAYSNARDEYTGEEGIFLDANENPYGELNRYPDPHQKELKQKLAELKGVEANNIFVGNGSDEVIDLAFRIFCNPGFDKALTFSPTYGMYDVSAAINNVELLKHPLNKDFHIDLEKLIPYFRDDSIKLLFICSPNNPTGNLMNKSSIEYILNNFKGIIIIDEAYIDFAEADSFIKRINQYNNLIVSQTLSKAWGLAGARIGTAYTNPDIVALYNKVKPPYNISKINQQAAIKSLNDPKTYENLLTHILSEKKRVSAELENIDFIKAINPSDTNFLLVEVVDANQLYHALVNKKIITRNRNAQVANCLRISIGTPEENDELLNTLKTLR